METTQAGSFQCEACQKQYKWKPELAGKKVRCKCGGELRVPKESPVPARVAAVPNEEKPAEEDVYGLNDLASVESTGRKLDDEAVYQSPPGFAAADSAPARQTAYQPQAAQPASSGGGGINFATVKWLGLSGGAVLVGIAVAIFCYHKSTAHEAFLKIAKETNATVVGDVSISKPRRSRMNEDRWTFKFPVRYTIDGVERTNQVDIVGEDLPAGFDSGRSDSWTGLSLKIFYNPKDPNEIEATAAAGSRNWIWGYVIALGLMGYGGWCFIKDRPTE